MRKIINKFGTGIAAICVVLAIVGYFLTRHRNPAIHMNQEFYIDEETGEESLHPVTDIPPLVNSRGNPALVEVLKFSCDGGKPFVAYYRKLDPKSKAKVEELEQAQNAQVAQGIPDTSHNDEILDYLTKGEMLRLPAPGSSWVSATTPEGEKVRDAAKGKDGRPGVQVYPE